MYQAHVAWLLEDYPHTASCGYFPSNCSRVILGRCSGVYAISRVGQYKEIGRVEFHPVKSEWAEKEFIRALDAIDIPGRTVA
jgi:hypothetical protein